MFYHPLLLHHQHRMQLYMPWQAATVSLKKIKKDSIIECNITKVCDFIMQFLTSDSRDPKKRLSLRLSIMLIHGSVLIWRQQVIFLEEDISQFIKRREKETERLWDIFRGKPETPSTPLAVIKKKRVKRVVAETPESLVDKEVPSVPVKFTLEPISLPDLFKDDGDHQARVAEITLREEEPRPQEPLLDDFGEPGMFLPILTMPISTSEQPQPHSIAVQVDVHAPAEELEAVLPQIQLEPEIVEQPQEVVPEITVRPASPQDIEVVAEKPAEEKERQAVAEKTVEKEKVTDQEEEWADICKVVEAPPPTPKALMKKVKSIAAALRLKRHIRKFRPINQKPQICDDEEDFMEIIREITRRLPAYKPMEKFFPEWQERVAGEVRAATEASARRTDTFGTALERSVETPSVGSLTQSLPPEVASSEVTYATTPAKRPLSIDETVIELMPPAANGVMGPPRSPTKKRKVITVEEAQPLLPTLQAPVPEKEIPLIEEFPQSMIVDIAPAPEEPVQQTIIPEMEIEDQARTKERREGDDFGVKWSNRIMRVVYKHNRITPIDICKELDKVLSKLNMSTIFACVLALAKDRYVLLHAAPDSLELEIVERGPKEYFK